ncbi:MAG TPA: glycosyltransferase family A protein [Thermoanaerobaculia bacterium]|nr:glycosyltransferase family A protein [Thermoanaerobaculia bacterium]
MKLSVVMAVFNGARELPSTLDSIAAQTLRDYELLAIDDGSTDETPSILASYAARDPRMRVLSQANAGLTRSLIRGCAEARTEVIARHDCGDRSLPERFARELALLEKGHVLVSCATRFVDADRDLLYTTRAGGDETRESLLHAGAAHIHALPHHGSAMFRREAYVAAGGYRESFRVAQDLDLWIRMAPLGTIGILDDVLYEALFDAKSISGSSRDAQLRLTEIAVALRDGGDTALLEQAARVHPAPHSTRGEAAALYFIGKCLLAQGNAKGRTRLREALAKNPWHWRARLSLLMGR